MLPASFGRTTGALGAMIAWTIASPGMFMLLPTPSMAGVKP